MFATITLHPAAASTDPMQLGHQRRQRVGISVSDSFAHLYNGGLPGSSASNFVSIETATRSGI